MKRIIFLFLGTIFSLFPRILTAQTTLLDSMHYTYSNLDSTLVPTGILYDRTIPFGKSNLYSGSSSDTVGYRSAWYQMYRNIYNSSYDPGTMVTIDSIINIEKSYLALNKVPIAILNMDYNTIKSNAADDNLLTFDNETNTIQDVAEREESPYELNHMRISAPLTAYGFGNDVDFIFPASLFFQNSCVPSQLSVDFGDGAGVVTVLFDQVHTVHYSSFGIHNILVDFSCGGNSVSVKAAYRTLSTVDGPDATWENEFLSFAGCSISSSYGINHARAYVKYANTDHILRKVVLIVEALDTDPDDHDYGTRYGRIGWDGFATGVFYDEDGKEIYPWLAQAPDAINDLYTHGYDVVILDFKKNRDYIQANANTLIKLIQYINSVKSGSEGITILGASMGGLISRYALKTMENSNCPHCTKLLITFDSPHQGANVPIGCQQWVKFFAQIDNDADNTYRKVLSSVAAMQMLVYHANTSSSSYRPSFQSELNSLGYPNQLKKVAVASGSANATFLPFGAGDELLNWLFHAPQIWSYAWAVPNSPSYASGQEIFKAKIPKNYNAGFWNTITLGLVTAGYIHQTVGLGFPTIPYDNAPGGKNTTVADIASHKPPKGLILSSNGSNTDNHCFVPTISALDITTPTVGGINALPDLFYNVASNITFSDPDHSLCPFDEIYAPSGNEYHVELNSTNRAWMLNKIINTSNYTISLPNTNGSTYNYGNAGSGFLPFTIDNGGTLQFNGNYASEYGSGPTPTPSSDLAISSSTLASNCWNGNITIKDGGAMIVGDETPTGSNNTAQVTLAGGFLTIEDGGTLIVNDNSSLIIESTGTLIFKQGATIELRGDHASLDIRGHLFIDDNAVFTVTNSLTSGHIGYVKFTPQSPLENNILTNGTGHGAEVNLIADGASTSVPDDCIMQITQNTLSDGGCDNFSVQGKIMIAQDADLSINSPLFLSNFSIVNLGSSGHKGLHVYGQSGVTLSNGTINNGLYSVRADLSNNGNDLTVSNLTIHDCVYGFLSNGEGLYLNGCTITDCEQGWKGTSMDNCSVNNTKIACSSFNSYSTDLGIDYYTSTGGGLSVTQSNISSNYTGIKMNGGQVVLSNARIRNNIADGVWLIDASIKANAGFTYANADISGNDYAIEYNGSHASTDLQIDQGFNDFASDVSNILFDQCPNATVNAKDNIWDVSGSTGGIASYSLASSLTCTLPSTVIDDRATTSFATPFCSSCYTGPTKRGREGEGEQPKYSSEEELNELYALAHRQLYYNSDTLIALNSYISLLQEPLISRPGNYELLGIAYSDWFKCIYTLAKKEYRHNKSTLLGDKGIKMQETLLKNLLSTADATYEMRYKINLDKAFLYRRIGKLEEAVSLLESMMSWVEQKHIEDLSYRHCTINTELMVKKGLVRKEDFFDVIQNCNSESKSMFENYKAINKNVAVSDFLLFPNPAEKEFSIEINASEETEFFTEILDMSGKQVYQIPTPLSLEKGINTFKIEVPELSSGVFTVLLHNNGQILRHKLIIVR